MKKPRKENYIDVSVWSRQKVFMGFMKNIIVFLAEAVIYCTMHMECLQEKYYA